VLLWWLLDKEREAARDDGPGSPDTANPAVHGTHASAAACPTLRAVRG
jgi:hypothetical protein